MPRKVASRKRQPSLEHPASPTKRVVRDASSLRPAVIRTPEELEGAYPNAKLYLTTSVNFAVDGAKETPHLLVLTALYLFVCPRKHPDRIVKVVNVSDIVGFIMQDDESSSFTVVLKEGDSPFLTFSLNPTEYLNSHNTVDEAVETIKRVACVRAPANNIVVLYMDSDSHHRLQQKPVDKWSGVDIGGWSEPATKPLLTLESRLQAVTGIC